MLNTKTIWRDNTMPPTNYIWMRTNMNDELIGVYEGLNGAGHRIKFGSDSDYRDVYSKTEVGDTLQLTETIEPSNAANKSVTGSSSNTSVATVSNGLVTGVSPGTATITVTTVQGSYTDTCVITVTPITYVQYKLATSFESGKNT